MSLGLTAAKWVSVALLATALFVFAFAIATDQDSLLHRYWSRYVAYLDRKLRNMFMPASGGRIAAGQLLALATVVGVAFALGNTLVYLLLPVAVFGPWIYIERLRKQRLRFIEAAMDGFILALANALKSTPSIGSALSYTLTLLDGALEEEVALALKEMRVGTGLDQALLNMAGRVQSVQLDATFSSLLIGRQVGGDLGKILETTADTLREMTRLKGVVRSKTAEGKAQLGLLVTLPIAVLFLFDLVSDGYFLPLTRSFAGWTVVLIATVLWVSSLLLARRVLSVDL